MLKTAPTRVALGLATSLASATLTQAEEPSTGGLTVFGMTIAASEHFIDACTSDDHLATVYFNSSYSTSLVEGVESMERNYAAVDYLETALIETDIKMTATWERSIESRTIAEVQQNFDVVLSEIESDFTTAIEAADATMAEIGITGYLYNGGEITVTNEPHPFCMTGGPNV